MNVVAKDKPSNLVIPGFKSNWIASDAEIFKCARSGVDTAFFYAFASTISMDNESLADMLHISSRTISNYNKLKKMLEPIQGEHLLKLIALYNKGTELFGNIAEFNYWLNKPFWNSAEKPVEWLTTPGGVDLVAQEMNALGYGYPA